MKITTIGILSCAILVMLSASAGAGLDADCITRADTLVAKR